MHGSNSKSSSPFTRTQCLSFFRENSFRHKRKASSESVPWGLRKLHFLAFQCPNSLFCFKASGRRWHFPSVNAIQGSFPFRSASKVAMSPTVIKGFFPMLFKAKAREYSFPKGRFKRVRSAGVKK